MLKRVIHRDIAARNFLVDARNNCFVCDFGMSIILPAGKTVVETVKEEAIPLAWCAPEAIVSHSWSEATDVYAFGVFLSEVLARQEPYFGLDLIKEVVPGVVRADEPLRPTVPGVCPFELVDVMMECLLGNAQERPSMRQINDRLRRYQTRVNKATVLSQVYRPYISDTEVNDTDNNKAYRVVNSSHYYVSMKTSPLFHHSDK